MCLASSRRIRDFGAPRGVRLQPGRKVGLKRSGFQPLTDPKKVSRSVNMCWSTVVELPQPKMVMWSQLELQDESGKVRTVRKPNWSLKSMSAVFCTYSTGFVFRSAESG